MCVGGWGETKSFFNYLVTAICGTARGGRGGGASGTKIWLAYETDIGQGEGYDSGGKKKKEGLGAERR